MNSKRHNIVYGFTLIEVLVVVSIIGILSAVLYASYSDARQDTRNRIMRTSIGEMQLALELYKYQNGHYPAPTNNSCRSGSGPFYAEYDDACSGNSSFVTGLVPDFIADLPVYNELSRNGNCSIQYWTDVASDPNAYKLTFERCIEGVTAAADGVQQSDEFARCPSTCANTGQCRPTEAVFYESIAVYSNGGECIDQ